MITSKPGDYSPPGTIWHQITQRPCHRIGNPEGLCPCHSDGIPIPSWMKCSYLAYVCLQFMPCGSCLLRGNPSNLLSTPCHPYGPEPSGSLLSCMVHHSPLDFEVPYRYHWHSQFVEYPLEWLLRLFLGVGWGLRPIRRRRRGMEEARCG